MNMNSKTRFLFFLEEKETRVCSINRGRRGDRSLWTNRSTNPTDGQCFLKKTNKKGSVACEGGAANQKALVIVQEQ